MPWMVVKIAIEGKPPVPNTINVDNIVRFGPRPGGSYIRFDDGNSIDVIDDYQSIQETVLKADAQK